MESLQEAKREYVEYIQKVAEVCDIEVLKSNENDLMNLSLKRLDSISIDVEEIYELYKTNKRMDRVLKEIDDFGVDYVRDYYDLKGESTNDQTYSKL